MLQKIQITLQYLLPKRGITQLIGLIANYKGGLLTQCIIEFLIYIYKIDMQEAQKQNSRDYLTLNEFLTRKLHKNARPIYTDPQIITMPADGKIIQMGKINSTGNLLQAKNHTYNLEGLLAGQDAIINHFYNGDFITIYLSPKNYHRIHMPCKGILREVIYVPGELFSVHPTIVKKIDNIFARNERVICFFEIQFGYMVQILIGSTITGSIETKWLGTITPPREGIIKHWHYPHTSNNPLTLLKGEEMGLFKIGSTVINLFSHGTITFEKNLNTNDITKVGHPLGKIGVNEYTKLSHNTLKQ
ncbi:archaetidylserine decarboxylase [Blochmannia endosymbiont of Polyrhachis (Hedomyrma) turneri]|uniref:archaetidylserine decarboxylase n=1 Tax=Blochmannia endosymbiont of Polyrhachis (Hedomyrma) turneri TaxID=1505596 RepID=UPI00061A7F5F|nr:archaetidylserine decarboxylase [Blochmannia endosymbiont of Polyrhachis (Hedomyrma) turneri]AKC59662.1 Phosphatidylserine decarboxylase proenzyme [Blochmannia endosymbiont of Polyrhachis (Hedomyrma) turneri]